MTTPSDSVFVGDLPPTIDDATIQAVFGAYGTIRSFKVFPVSARGQGNCIISFGSVDEATWIVNNLNGNIPQGLSAPITVTFKQARRGPPMGGGMGGMGGMGLTPPANANWGGGAAAPMGGGGAAAAPVVASASLFIGDLPADMNDMTLQTIFGAYGTVVSHKLLQPGTSGKLAAIITFDNVTTASWIVDNLHGNIPQGLTEPIVARYKNQGPKPAAGGDGGFGSAPGAYGAPNAYGAPGGAPGGGGYGGAPGGGGYGGAQGGGSYGATGPQDPSVTLFVGDLPQGIDEQTLQSVLGAYGNITSLKLLTPGTTGAAAVVNFGSAAEAQWCVDNLNDNIPQGLTTPIKCRFKTPSKGKGWSPY